MSPLAQILCLCTFLTSAPVPQMPQRSWDIRYKHEPLSHRKHLLRLSVDYYLIEPEQAMRQRMHAFAENFAAETCSGRFAFIHDRRLSRIDLITPLAAQFVFRCL